MRTDGPSFSNAFSWDFDRIGEIFGELIQGLECWPMQAVLCVHLLSAAETRTKEAVMATKMRQGMNTMGRQGIKAATPRNGIKPVTQGTPSGSPQQALGGKGRQEVAGSRTTQHGAGRTEQGAYGM